MAVVLITAIVIAFKAKGKDDEDLEINKHIIITFFFILFLTFLTTAHISGKFAYVRYIYNIIPLCVIFVTALIKLISKKFSLNLKAVAVGLIVSTIIGTIGLGVNNKSTFILTDLAKNQQAVIKECEERPLIVLNNGKTFFTTGNFGILSKCKDLYVATTDEINVDELINGRDIENGVVFIVISENDWSQGYNDNEVMTKLISASEKLNAYNEAGTVSSGTVYIAE